MARLPMPVVIVGVVVLVLGLKYATGWSSEWRLAASVGMTMVVYFFVVIAFAPRAGKRDDT